MARPHWLAVVMAGAIAATLAACAKDEPAAAVVRPVLVQKIGAADAGSATKYVGDIRARHESDLGFRIPGKIVARLVDVGAIVTAGQILARIDQADAALQGNQAEANLSLAEAEAKRYRDLRAKNFVSQAALDAKETTLQAAQAQAGLMRNQSTYTRLTADHGGVVTAVLAEVGQVVAVGQGVLRVARSDEKEAVISVPEGQVEALRAAKNLTVTTWAHPDEQLSGRLRELAPAADAATRTYTARISITQSAASLQLGMTATVNLPPANALGILVPASAVVDEGQGPAVWVVVDDKVVRRAIRIRQQREDGVLVETGLQPGELIVIVGAHKLVAGQAVRPQLQNAGSGTRP
jgi:multidrug efflux system membrane fusion protein